MVQDFKVGTAWFNHIQKPYMIIQTTLNDIHYVSATVTSASGKIYIKSKKDFQRDFTFLPEDGLAPVTQKAINNTRVRQGITL